MKCVSDVCLVVFFLLNDTATTEIYTLSLHDALPISDVAATREILDQQFGPVVLVGHDSGDRKSTRLNSSHANISYAVFYLKKKNIISGHEVNHALEKCARETRGGLNSRQGVDHDVGVYLFFFNDTATTEIYTLSLHDALPIYFSGAFCLSGGDIARDFRSSCAF